MPRLIRFFALIFSLSLGLVPPASAGPGAMSIEEARHLLSRTGFGAAPHEIAALTGISYEAAVDRLLQVTPEPVTPMPAWVDHWGYPTDQIFTLPQGALELFFSMRYLEIAELQHWWLTEMIATEQPLQERMTLFWHDHFATSFEGTENAILLARQHLVLRQHALGSFEDLAVAMLRDPALLIYLTNTDNSREAPNENLAREFFELFTLGEGRGYSEADVTEAARALTGYTIAELSSPNFHFNAAMHDAGLKQIFGQHGSFEGVDLVPLTLRQPDFGPYIVEALWREFISDTPDPSQVAELSALWRNADWQITPLLRALLLSEAFWDPANRGRLVKEPIELMVGAVRTLGIEMPDTGALNWVLEDMGHQLFFPPNVAGWPEGTEWIHEGSVAARAQALTYLTDPGAIRYITRDAAERRDAALDLAEDFPDRGEVTQEDAGVLRVGHVFGLQAVESDEGNRLLFTLYDVGFRGDTFRSLTIWIGQEGGAHEPYAMGFHVTDCRPACFANWPHDEEPDWVGFVPLLGPPSAALYDHELVAAITANLGALLESTRGQQVWRHGGWDIAEDERPMRPRIARRLVADLQDQVTSRIAPVDLPLVLRPSVQGGLGLGPFYRAGLSRERGAEMFQTMAEGLSRTARPPVVYESAEAWFAALPSGADRLPQARAAQALLALQPASVPSEPALFGPSMYDILRALVLSPEFQVN